jgi:hypothetical protein
MCARMWCWSVSVHEQMLQLYLDERRQKKLFKVVNTISVFHFIFLDFQVQNLEFPNYFGILDGCQHPIYYDCGIFKTDTADSCVCVFCFVKPPIHTPHPGR